jgi:hypothetical protein
VPNSTEGNITYNKLYKIFEIDTVLKQRNTNYETGTQDMQGIIAAEII